MKTAFRLNQLVYVRPGGNLPPLVGNIWYYDDRYNGVWAIYVPKEYRQTHPMVGAAIFAHAHNITAMTS